MPTVLLADFWGDFYSAGGFWVGVVSFFVGVLGFAYTIHQVRKTQSAAEAAKQAAQNALEESRRIFRRHSTAQAAKLLGELRLFVEHEKWESAGVRADDLAEVLARIQRSEVTDWVLELRDFANVFRAKAKAATTKIPPKTWAELLRNLHQLLDQENVPFAN